MNYPTVISGALFIILGATLLFVPAPVHGQQRASAIEEVVITGSRIRRDPLNEATPITQIEADELVKTGLTNLGDVLQRLPITGSAPNSQFNVPGNSGFPQDGAGIGAGAVQLSLRNVEAKRTLVLVDGKRWIAGASASGVPSTVDLNTIPDNIIQRIEILQDGASAIYGSDAIGGVVNIITNRDFEGFRFNLQTGGFLEEGDGESQLLSALWGGGNDTTHVVLSASYADEGGIETADRQRSRFPNPNARSCDVPGSNCSSFTPQGRFIFGPNLAGGASVTLRDGVLNDGGANIPAFDPNNPGGGDFKPFTAADRFNYNGPTFNYLRTPNERVNLYASARHQLAPNLALLAQASYTNRTSATKAAPEPLCLGNGCGNAINNNFVVSARNPFNPFGADLSVANGTLQFFGRRPLESGGRLFFQDVNTYFLSVGLEGEFAVKDRSFYWDVTASYGDNRGFQEKLNSHNAAKLQVAMGDPAICAATPNCVPFNFFGGQGPDGRGSITQEMLDFVTYTQRDFSEQTLENVLFNIGGDLFELPAGTVGFAAGFEYRDQAGSFRPDPIAERGETAGIPSGRTAGAFDVTEYYGELIVPLISGAQTLELNLAARNSDYSTSGSEATYKVSALYQPSEHLSLRGSLSSGFRAPGIGELFGGAAREDAALLDPCSDVLGQFGARNGGRDLRQPQNIIDNCAALGVPTNYVATNLQFSVISAGNPELKAETSDAFSVGAVYSAAIGASWIESVTVSFDYYNLEIEDAIQGRIPADLVVACVNTLDPLFCDLTPRTSSGGLDVVNNRLQNIGGIEASGFDFLLRYTGPVFAWGQLDAAITATYLEDYIERTANVDGTQTLTERTGTHTRETFQRAFPELRAVATIDWTRERYSGSLALRWTDDMLAADGSELDSVVFTDLRLSYAPKFGAGAWRVTLGFNNLLDEDPPVLATSTRGMSNVLHDLPGRVGYLRVSYQR